MLTYYLIYELDEGAVIIIHLLEFEIERVQDELHDGGSEAFFLRLVEIKEVIVTFDAVYYFFKVVFVHYF